MDTLCQLSFSFLLPLLVCTSRGWLQIWVKRPHQLYTLKIIRHFGEYEAGSFSSLSPLSTLFFVTNVKPSAAFPPPKVSCAWPGGMLQDMLGYMIPGCVVATLCVCVCACFTLSFTHVTLQFIGRLTAVRLLLTTRGQQCHHVGTMRKNRISHHEITTCFLRYVPFNTQSYLLYEGTFKKKCYKQFLFYHKCFIIFNFLTNIQVWIILQSLCFFFYIILYNNKSI